MHQPTPHVGPTLWPQCTLPMATTRSANAQYSSSSQDNDASSAILVHSSDQPQTGIPNPTAIRPSLQARPRPASFMAGSKSQLYSATPILHSFTRCPHLCKPAPEPNPTRRNPYHDTTTQTFERFNSKFIQSVSSKSILFVKTWFETIRNLLNLRSIFNTDEQQFICLMTILPLNVSSAPWSQIELIPSFRSNIQKWS